MRSCDWRVPDRDRHRHGRGLGDQRDPRQHGAEAAGQAPAGSRLESTTTEGEAASVVRQDEAGPLPGVQKLLGKTGAGEGLSEADRAVGRAKRRPAGFWWSAAGWQCLACSACCCFLRWRGAAPVGLLLGALPFLFLMQRRSARIKKFEEQFPEALDLLSRALRAGHAFQTSLGMVADEVRSPSVPSSRRRSTSRTSACRSRSACSSSPIASRCSTCASLPRR